jgi:hypothetical protein
MKPGLAGNYLAVAAAIAGCKRDEFIALRAA